MNHENELLTLEIKGLPPTVNNMYRNKGHSRYKTQATRDFQDSLIAILKSLWGNQSPFIGRAALHIQFSQKDKRRWDIDNRVKALQDCLQSSGVIKDDSQIDVLYLERINQAQETFTNIKLFEII